MMLNNKKTKLNRLLKMDTRMIAWFAWFPYKKQNPKIKTTRRLYFVSIPLTFPHVTLWPSSLPLMPYKLVIWISLSVNL